MTSIKNIGVYLAAPVARDAATRRAELLAEVTSAQLKLLIPREHLDHLDVARLVSELRVSSRVVALESGSADDVRDAVVAHNLDIILKTARPLPGSRKVVGGVARDLLRYCPRPVWIVRQSASEDRAPVIAAVSNLVDPAAEAETRLIIQTAANIALYEGRELVVAHAWLPLQPGLGQLGRSERRLYMAEHRLWMLEKLGKLVKKSIDIEARLELVEGNPSRVLLELAASLASETIVVGHRGRSGFGAFLFGNTGELLIEGSHSNVLSVRAA